MLSQKINLKLVEKLSESFKVNRVQFSLNRTRQRESFVKVIKRERERVRDKGGERAREEIVNCL